MNTLNNLLSGTKKNISRADIELYIKNKTKKPVYGRMQHYLERDYKAFVTDRVDKDTSVVLLDLGSYNRRLTPNTINVDIFQEGDTDLVWDITKKLPLKSNSVDFVVCSAVLEHVSEPIDVVSEIYRVLRPGGVVWADVPFFAAVS